MNGKVADLTGTARELCSETGEVHWRGEQGLWGPHREEKIPILLRRYLGDAANEEVYCELRYQGQVYDAETGLYYNRHRYYDPELGQYISADPIGLAGGLRPQGYVHNPMEWVDPLGLTKSVCSPKKNRRQALNEAKDQAGIPRSQQPDRQWTVGNDPKRQGQTNYKYSDDLASHGRYYEYTDAYGHKKVVLEHTADPRAPYSHAHAGKAKAGADPRTYDFKENRYQKIINPSINDHHIYYE
ncbi:Rhs family protein [Dickeya dadantii]|nr:Rhs family protein [Dickeya dadantii]